MRNTENSRARKWQKNRFDKQDDEPLGPLANLLDLMLVFACGLIAALISMSQNITEHFETKAPEKRIVEQGREIPNLPSQSQSAGEGYESVGQVYRDPKTGKLILIGK